MGDFKYPTADEYRAFLDEEEKRMRAERVTRQFNLFEAREAIAKQVCERLGITREQLRQLLVHELPFVGIHEARMPITLSGGR